MPEPMLAVVAHSVAPGTPGPDVIAITESELAGADIDGSADLDTLQLVGGGTFDFTTLGTFANIETIQGSAAADVVVLSVDQLAGIQKLDGGEGVDRLTLLGDSFNLSGLEIIGFEELILQSSNWGIEVTLANKATALLVRPQGEGAKSLTLTGDTFTSDDLRILFAGGFDTITDAARTYQNEAPVVTDLSGSIRVTPSGTAFLDVGSDATVTDEAGLLASLEVSVSSLPGQESDNSVGIDVSGAVSLSNEMNVDSEVSVAGIVIGKIAAVSASGFLVSFNTEATQTRVAELVRALTYTNLSADLS